MHRLVAIIVSLQLLPLSHAVAQAAVPLVEAQMMPPRRSDVRVRAGVSLVGWGVSEEWNALAWQRTIMVSAATGVERGPWREVGLDGQLSSGGGGAGVGLQIGMQTDAFAAYVFARVSMGSVFVFSTGLVAEVTLADAIQLGVGPSLDMGVLQHLSSSASVNITSSDGRVIGSEINRYVGVVGEVPNSYDGGFGSLLRRDRVFFAPGFDVRLGFATGGGPYERRGLVIAPFFHVTVPSGGLMLYGGIELGLQTF